MAPITPCQGRRCAIMMAVLSQRKDLCVQWCFCTEQQRLHERQSFIGLCSRPLSLRRSLGSNDMYSECKVPSVPRGKALLADHCSVTVSVRQIP